MIQIKLDNKIIINNLFIFDLKCCQLSQIKIVNFIVQYDRSNLLAISIIASRKDMKIIIEVFKK